MAAIALAIVTTISPNIDIDGNDAISSLFEGLFTEISEEIYVMPGDPVIYSFNTLESDTPLLWGVEVLEYTPQDRITIRISDTLDETYAEVAVEEAIMFEVIEVAQADTLDFEISNQGDEPVTILLMFNENPEADALFDPDQPVMTVILPLAVSGILLVSGMIVAASGAILSAMDWRNNKNSRRYYDDSTSI